LLISPDFFQHSDGDGISDLYEISYDFNFLFVDDLTIDTDGDNLTNLQEFNAGTDPTLSDTDGDNVSDTLDAFPLDATESIDTDLDGIGNNADTDDDGDGFLDTDEIAAKTDPLDSESLPLDTDGDFISNVTDSDDDGDGILDEFDAFTLDATESIDTDLDSLGNNADTDDDGDGFLDTDEIAAENDPLNSESLPLDTDGDFISNVTDTDDDGDGILDEFDAFPLDATESIDTDLDGIGNNADTDDDGDGFLDTDEIAAENDPLNSESLPLDTDGDFISNVTDTDDDGDGILDEFDAFPFDPLENADNDFDGIGNNADSDDDGDGIPDTYELANQLNPLDANDAGLDEDSDGLTNLIEFALGTNINNADTDEDGIADNIENNPLVFDEVEQTLYSGQLYVLPDMTADGVKELGVLNVNTESSQVSLEVLNGKSQASIRTIVWSDSYVDSSISVHVVDDMNNNGVSEVGLFGVKDKVNNESKPQMFVRDLSTGSRVNVFNWPANWKQASAQVLSDMTGDGVAEIGLQGRFKDGQRP
jgi:hypothetical protein